MHIQTLSLFFSCIFVFSLNLLGMERPPKAARIAPEKETISYPPHSIPKERESYPISPSSSEASMSATSGKRKQLAPTRAFKKPRANETFSITYYLQNKPNLIKSKIQGNNLDLAGLNISSLEGLLAIPGIKNILNISLAHNSITQVERKDLAGLSQLITLDLSNNDIEVLLIDGFTELANLHRLFLNNNRIFRIEHDAFAGLDNLKVLSLSHNRLTKLQQKMFAGVHNLEELLLQDNAIDDIEKYTFSDTPLLRKLKLNKNQLIKLTGTMFEGRIHIREQYRGQDKLTYLEDLDLRDNKLTEIPTSILVNLPELQRLLLSNNQIRKVTSPNIAALKKADNLKILDLTNNNFSEADLKKLKAALPDLEIIATVSMETTEAVENLIGGFSATKSLSDFEKAAQEYQKTEDLKAAKALRSIHRPPLYMYLKSEDLDLWDLVKGSLSQQWYDLQNRGITNLDGLLDLPSIENVFRIYLNKNKIKSIPAHAFFGLGRLKDIDLTKNQITHIDPKAFEGLPSIRSLNMSSNPSLPLRADYLKPLKNLQSLILETNGIKTIPDFAFQDLINLKSLYLDHNELTHISHEQLAGLENLEALMLHNNQIKYIDPAIFTKLPKLQLLNLLNNPLTKENVDAIRKVLPKTKISF